MIFHPEALSQQAQSKLATLTRQADLERMRRNSGEPEAASRRSEIRVATSARLSRI